MSLLRVLVAAVVTDLATGVGALPLAFKRKGGREWLGISNSMAAGAMMAASGGLALEGSHHQLSKTLLGVVVGVVLMSMLRRVLAGREPRWGEVNPRDARRIFIVVAVMTLHSFTEGIGIGVSFGGGQPLGTFVTAAMAIHNMSDCGSGARSRIASANIMAESRSSVCFVSSGDGCAPGGHFLTIEA